MISGNMVGSYSQMGKTFILTDGDGNEITGVIVDQETIFTAGDNDVREGMVYASDDGVSTGTKDIPAYRTTCGTVGIFPGESFLITNLADYDKYNYTELQCIICKFNTTLNNSTCAEKISLNNKVFPVNSFESESDVVKNSELKAIDFNIKNNSEDIYVIHYFTYKEEY